MELRSILCVFMTSLLLAGVCQYMAFQDNFLFVAANRVTSIPGLTPIGSYEVEITKQLAYPVMSSLVVRITIPEWFDLKPIHILTIMDPMLPWELLFTGINATIVILVAILLTAT